LVGLDDGPLYGGGGSLANPMGWPGYGQLHAGHWWVYEWMLQHPTVQHARADTVNPLVASAWTYTVRDGLGGRAKRRAELARGFVAEVLDGLRHSVVTAAVAALDYGPAFFEPVWADREGRRVIERVKPLSSNWAMTQVLLDAKGNFTGLRSATGDGAALEVRRAKAWKFTWDGAKYGHWGRPLLENLRETAWKMWVDAAQQIQALGGKLSGRQAYAIVPAGGYPDPKQPGKQRTFAQDAQDALTAFHQGKSPVLTSPSGVPLNAGNMEAWAKIAGQAFVQFNAVDHGSNAPAIAAMQGRMEHAESLMFEGYLRSPRTGQEAEHGSRADAEQHTDTATLTTQVIGNELAFQAQPLADWLAGFNFGLPAGTVRVQQAELVDRKRAARKATFDTLLQTDDAFRAEVIRITDVDQIMDEQGLPRKHDFDEAKVAADRAQQKAAGADGDPGKPAADDETDADDDTDADREAA
ncbi:MAG: hypothetical protein JWO31_79, partial [Phycisphaerales bacterium]|nr:hypothetical protein [Phycisphaerales bacterium]